jgi:multiple sugar transport system substrate-binding protein
MASVRRYPRRKILMVSGVALGLAGLAACGATPTPQVVKEVVTSVVEKEVTKIVEGTPQVVKETVVVEKQVTAQAAPPKAVEIRWACYALGEARQKAGQACADDFMAKNPNVKVALEWRPGQGYWDKLQTEFAGGTAPDVTINQMDWVIPGAARGMFLDLKPLIERDHFDMGDYWYPLSLEWEWRGGLYGLLLYAGGQALYVNKTLLAEAGLDLPKPDWTWDDFLMYAKALTNEEKGQWGVLDANVAPPYWACSFIHGAGGTVLNDAYNKCTLTEPAALEGVHFLYDLVFKYKVMPTPAVTAGLEQSLFETGKAGMAFAGTFWVGMIRDASKAQGWEWEFAHMPVHPRTRIRKVQLGSNSWSVIANTQHRNEAWALVAYLGGPDGQRQWMAFGLPGMKSVLNSQEFLNSWKPQDVTIPVGDMECCGHDYYPTPDCGEYWTALGQEWGSIWSGEATVEEAMTRICKALDEIFARRPPYYEKVVPTPTSG